METIALLNKAVKGKHGGDRRSDDFKLANSKLETVSHHIPFPSGATRTYALQKLEQDRPDLYAQVLAKKISPHAAMVEAGFRPDERE